MKKINKKNIAVSTKILSSCF